MARRLWAGGGWCDDALRNREIPAVTTRRSEPSAKGGNTMQWTTPTAIDFRLGFEITMYVSAR
jgi:coenzyme PQQ precursor peptide PqqA